jgi:sulfonate transport system substrate-binding protein
MSARPIVRVAGVPEHFNAPWHLALEAGAFDALPFSVEFTHESGGTGALCEALTTGRQDLVVLLTEGAVADILGGSNTRLVGTWVGSSLCWGIHVHAASHYQTVDDLRGRRFAISRFGSGSHLMTFVEALARGWDVEDDVTFVRVGNLEGARRTLGAEHADAFLWEKYTTKPVVDRGEWRRIGECPTPWPAFVFATTATYAEEHLGWIEQILATIQGFSKSVMNDREGSVAWIAKRYGLRVEDTAAWFDTVQWVCDRTVDADAIRDAVRMLHRAGIVPTDDPAAALAACL